GGGPAGGGDRWAAPGAALGVPECTHAEVFELCRTAARGGSGGADPDGDCDQPDRGDAAAEGEGPGPAQGTYAGGVGGAALRADVHVVGHVPSVRDGGRAKYAATAGDVSAGAAGAAETGAGQS